MMNEYNDFKKVGTWIGLNSGRSFDLANPRDSILTIQDIAHSLANSCRFSGHCDKFYSIAEHSVMVSYLIEPEFAFDGLLHDVSEAVLGDVTTPLKKLLPDYNKIEVEIETVLFKRFGIEYPLRREVKVADLTALAIEKRDLMKNSGHWPILDGLSIPPGITAYGKTPDVAKAAFLRRFYELSELRIENYEKQQKDVDSQVVAG